MSDYDEDGRNERLLPCGQEVGDCCAAGSGCDGCGDNPDNNPGLCGHCNGSGEGMHPGTKCDYCKGHGVDTNESDDRPGPNDGKEE